MQVYKSRIKNFSFYILVASLCLPIKFTTVATLLFIVVLIGTQSLAGIKKLVKEPIIIILISYFIILGTYVLLEEDKAYGLKYIERYLPFLTVPFIIQYIRGISEKKKEFSDIVLILSVTMAGLFSVLTALNNVDIIDLYEFSVALTESSIISSNYFAIFIAISGLVALELLLRGTLNKSIRTVYIIIILFFILYLVLLAARSALFTMLFLMTLRIVQLLNRAKNYSTIIITLISLTIMVFSFVLLSPYLKQRIVTFYTHGFESDFRYFEFKAAYNAIKIKPIFGYGIEGVETALVKQYTEFGFVEGMKYRFNAHNQLFQSVLHFGIFGLLWISLLYFYLGQLAFRSNHWLTFAFVFLFISFSVTEALLERSKGIIFLTFFLGYFFPQKRKILYGR